MKRIKKYISMIILLGTLALPYIDNCGKRIKILQAGFVFREPVLIIRL